MNEFNITGIFPNYRRMVICKITGALIFDFYPIQETTGKGLIIGTQIIFCGFSVALFY